MHRNSLIIIIIYLAQISKAQFIDLDTITTSTEYENVTSEKIYSDSIVTTFKIWVKTEVPLHKHAFHTEQVMVLEGEANMRLGDEWKMIKAGDLIIIPPGTLHAVIVTSSTPLKVLSIQAPMYDGSDKILINNIENK